jgi:integrase
VEFLDKPGVDKLGLHDLRHTAGSDLARCKDMKFIAEY